MAVYKSQLEIVLAVFLNVKFAISANKLTTLKHMSISALKLLLEEQTDRQTDLPLAVDSTSTVWSMSPGTDDCCPILATGHQNSAGLPVCWTCRSKTSAKITQQSAVKGKNEHQLN